MTGPGHGGPGLVANTYLEGTYSEVYPRVSRDEEGMRRLFRQFSFPGGVPSHVAPETPGSIHEGGELGYSLSHAFGAAFDNPGLLVACVVGDGEAETGPLATSWHSNKFLNPVRDGAVLPILHLNGYKIAGPTVLARIPRGELGELLRGYGWEPLFVEGHEPAAMHRLMADTLDRALDSIREIQSRARASGSAAAPALADDRPRLAEGMDGPEGRGRKTGRGDVAGAPGAARQGPREPRAPAAPRGLDAELPARGALRRARPPPAGALRTRAEGRSADGGESARERRSAPRRSRTPRLPGVRGGRPEAGRDRRRGDARAGPIPQEVLARNAAARNFRIFSPDETTSNRWDSVFDVTDRLSVAELLPTDDHVGPDGRVLEMLSEHQCEGWLEGYLLTGRHGFFSCYEAFIHIVDSMFNQHAKWLKTTNRIPWRKPIASLNILLSSHVWRQDHNGFSHQDPGFLDHVANKKAEVIRIYLPPDANTLLSVTDHCLRSRQYVNVVVAGKQPAPQWLDREAAARHAAAGIGVWEWASHDGGRDPDVVMACAGDVPTLETLAAVSLLRKEIPDLRIRVVNVLDLMRLQPPSEHPHGLPDAEFDASSRPTGRSSSRSTATRRSFTGSPTGAPTTTTSTCAATRRRARRRRPSTCASSTISTGSASRSTSSTASRACASGRPPCASASSRSARSTASGCAGPARTCPK